MLKWGKNTKLWKKEGRAWFTPPSIAHFIIWGMLLSWLVNPYTSHPILVATLIHLAEELLENYGIFSMEGILSRMTNCTSEGWMDLYDSDSIQNFLGDMISGFLGAVIAIQLLPQPPTWFVWFGIMTMSFIYAHICIILANK